MINFGLSKLDMNLVSLVKIGIYTFLVIVENENVLPRIYFDFQGNPEIETLVLHKVIFFF